MSKKKGYKIPQIPKKKNHDNVNHVSEEKNDVIVEEVIVDEKAKKKSYDSSDFVSPIYGAVDDSKFDELYEFRDPDFTTPDRYDAFRDDSNDKEFKEFDNVLHNTSQIRKIFGYEESDKQKVRRDFVGNNIVIENEEVKNVQEKNENIEINNDLNLETAQNLDKNEPSFNPFDKFEGSNALDDQTEDKVNEVNIERINLEEEERKLEIERRKLELEKKRQEYIKERINIQTSNEIDKIDNENSKPSFGIPNSNIETESISINKDSNLTFEEASSKLNHSTIHNSSLDTLCMSNSTYYKDFILPPLSLLDTKSVEIDKHPEWIDQQIDALESTFDQFNINASVAGFKKGPSVTRYEIDLAKGINVKKILQIKDNLKMNLAAKDIRIEAPIPGKPFVGIEIPNVKTELVKFGQILENPNFYSESAKLNVGLGLNIEGDPVFTDISSMPHGLIAGTTGSGKSVCINTLLISLLMKNSPKDLRLLLVDPKEVELAAYNDLPHLVTPVISNAQIAAGGLLWAVKEMDRRYAEFARHRVRNISSYNQRMIQSNEGDTIPYIVIVIDELADLMMQASQEVEDSIQRLTQKSRACGIHLIIATQRPTTDVVKGTIKANIPSRIAFRVSSNTDSLVILDKVGAESLLGRGDMLISDNGFDQQRVQGAYISDLEIDSITEFVRSNSRTRYLFMHDELEKMTSQSSSSGNNGNSAQDGLIKEVAKFVVENKTASINKITKQFRVGFNRAQAIVDELEKLKIVSENKGSRARDVLVDISDLETIF